MICNSEYGNYRTKKFTDFYQNGVFSVLSLNDKTNTKTFIQAIQIERITND